MAWCEMNQVDFVFGLARNARLVEEISVELLQAEAEASVTGKPARHFKDFRYATLDSWSRRRRVVAKAEWTNGEANPRFIVTSLSKAETSARFLYEKVYCARGEMENRIKECQGDLFADRTSSATLCANQLRLWLASFAYALLCAVRRIGLAHTQFAEATCGTIGSSSSSSPVSSASARGVSNSRSPQPVPTPTNGGWPPLASSQPPDASPQRRKNAAIQPTTHRSPPKDRPPSAQTAPGTRSSSPRPLPNLVRSPKTKPRL